jgi:hypothetical protein
LTPKRKPRKLCWVIAGWTAETKCVNIMAEFSFLYNDVGLGAQRCKV